MYFRCNKFVWIKTIIINMVNNTKIRSMSYFRVTLSNINVIILDFNSMNYFYLILKFRKLRILWKSYVE